MTTTPKKTYEERRDEAWKRYWDYNVSMDSTEGCSKRVFFDTFKIAYKERDQELIEQAGDLENSIRENSKKFIQNYEDIPLEKTSEWQDCFECGERAMIPILQAKHEKELSEEKAFTRKWIELESEMSSKLGEASGKIDYLQTVMATQKTHHDEFQVKAEREKEDVFSRVLLTLTIDGGNKIMTGIKFAEWLEKHKKQVIL